MAAMRVFIRLTCISAFLLLIFSEVSALTVSVSAAVDTAAEKSTIVGTTNLPDGIVLLITLRSVQSGYLARDTAAVKDGAFRADPFLANGSGLRPGNYVLEVQMPIADLQPRATWPVLGKDGVNLQAPLIQQAKVGGTIVEYKTHFKVDAGPNSDEREKVSGEQAQEGASTWWARLSKNMCDVAEDVARSRNDTFDRERFYSKCLADEPKKKWR